jgi:membrane protease YdiL (CAAX protease family)
MDVRQALRQASLQTPGFLVAGVVVYGLTRALRFRYRPWPFLKPRQAALWGVAAVLASSAIVSALMLLAAQSRTAPMPAMSEVVYDPQSVVNQALFALLVSAPVLVTMRLRREPWASAGLGRHNLGRAAALGTLLGLVPVASQWFAGGRHAADVTAGLTANHLWALLQFGVVGFFEEFMFRGYLQTRLLAWLGRWQGWLAASVLMALVHIPQRIGAMALSFPEALVSSALLTPISLFLGYLMLRTENVAAPAVLHVFADWVNTL